MSARLVVLLAATACIGVSAPTARAEIKVVTSIKPIHSLVSAVMKDVGTPALLVDGANSPHTYNMRPSDAKALSTANVVFWVGDELEAFLKKPIEALGDKATVVSLMESEGILELPVREGDGFDAHEGHAGHDHAHEEHAHEEKKEEAGHDHAHGEHDAHIWLDPENAKVIIKTAAQTLSKADTANATKYAANAEAAMKQLDGLSAEIKSSLGGSKNSFIVFHDAYQYFEKRFGISASGAISIHPENPPGAKAIRAIRKRLKKEKITCVYAEPQFDAKLVNTITEGTKVKTGVLDPLGASLQPGPELYFTLLRDLASNIKGC